jgi:hypothetical protein
VARYRLGRLTTSIESERWSPLIGKFGIGSLLGWLLPIDRTATMHMNFHNHITDVEECLHYGRMNAYEVSLIVSLFLRLAPDRSMLRSSPWLEELQAMRHLGVPL